jgi:type IV fimbrial biogenesis protein FimT
MSHAAKWMTGSPTSVRQRLRAPSFGRGFTLIELMVVLLILAILLGLAAPAFRTLVFAQRVKTASFDVFSSLVMARSEAIARNWIVTVKPPADGNWANGWTVECFDPETNPTLNRCLTAGTPLVIRSQNAYTNIAITGPGTPRICFNSVGRLTTPNPAGEACQTANVSLSLTSAGASQDNSRCVTIDPSGRPVSRTGTCS